jgi:hypothetical protein
MTCKIENIYKDILVEYGLQNSLVSTSLESKIKSSKNKGFANILSTDVFDLSDALKKFIVTDLGENIYRFRSYDDETIKYILKEMRVYGYNISETASIFNVSRNTIRKWMNDEQREKCVAI